MDQEMTARGGPELGMYACDRDLFDRVWKRVMPEERFGCPITPDPPAVHIPSPAPSGNCTPSPAPSGSCTPMAPAPHCVPDTAPGQPIEPAPAPPEPPAAENSMPAGNMPAPEPPAAGTMTPAANAPAPEPPAERAPMPEPAESAAHTGDDFPRPDAVPCLGSGSASHGGQLQEDILTALEGWQLYRHLARKVTGTSSRALSALASEKHRQARRLAAAYFLISGVRYWPTVRLEVPLPGGEETA